VIVRSNKHRNGRGGQLARLFFLFSYADPGRLPAKKAGCYRGWIRSENFKKNTKEKSDREPMAFSRQVNRWLEAEASKVNLA
jgi:hypothetical protein